MQGAHSVLRPFDFNSRKKKKDKKRSKSCQNDAFFHQVSQRVSVSQEKSKPKSGAGIDWKALDLKQRTPTGTLLHDFLAQEFPKFSSFKQGTTLVSVLFFPPTPILFVPHIYFSHCENQPHNGSSFFRHVQQL
jgi:hypothetical protein